ncbi:MAG: cation diffusion facilitator family transporter [Lachnospiraceae bacterium]|nr:cation diffusion facilitator family transporter [Lachnospiraceae bacterium]
MSRGQKIIRVSVVGILVNVMLAVFKMVIGILSNSIAIVLDAVNNLSDALSSVITIIGTRLSERKPDKKHPFGHGRIEYISASVISVIILYAGLTALLQSLEAVLSPRTPDYDIPGLVIVGVAVVVKFSLGAYFQKKGKELQSDSLTASGEDARNDSFVSLSTLIAAIVFEVWGLSIEAFLGVVISVLMIKSGVEMLGATISQILGERPGSDMAKAIKDVVNSFPEVSGVYDLVLHNYGPDNLIGSFHIELPGEMTVTELDRLERDIVDKVYEECNVVITGISVYGLNLKDDVAARIQNDIRKTVLSRDYVLQMHGFYLNMEDRKIQFDAVIDFDAPDREEVYKNVVKEVSEKYPDYNVRVGFDADVSD